MLSADRAIQATKKAKLDIGLGETNRLIVVYRPTEVAADDIPEDETTEETMVRVIESWEFGGPVPTRDLRPKIRHNPETGEDEIVEPAMAKGALVAEGEVIPLDPDVLKKVHPATKLGIIQAIAEDCLPNPMGRSQSRSRR